MNVLLRYRLCLLTRMLLRPVALLAVAGTAACTLPFSEVAEPSPTPQAPADLAPFVASIPTPRPTTLPFPPPIAFPTLPPLPTATPEPTPTQVVVPLRPTATPAGGVPPPPTPTAPSSVLATPTATAVRTPTVTPRPTRVPLFRDTPTPTPEPLGGMTGLGVHPPLLLLAGEGDGFAPLVYALDGDLRPMPVPPGRGLDVWLRSDNPDVAIATASGTVFGLSPGEATLTVGYGNHRTHLRVVVSDRPDLRSIRRILHAGADGRDVLSVSHLLIHMESGLSAEQTEETFRRLRVRHEATFPEIDAHLVRLRTQTLDDMLSVASNIYRHPHIIRWEPDPFALAPVRSIEGLTAPPEALRIFSQPSLLAFDSVGDSDVIALAAIHADGRLRPLPGSETVAFGSTNAAIVTVDADGRAQSAGPGRAHVVVEHDRVQFLVPVTVTVPEYGVPPLGPILPFGLPDGDDLALNRLVVKFNGEAFSPDAALEVCASHGLRLIGRIDGANAVLVETDTDSVTAVTDLASLLVSDERVWLADLVAVPPPQVLGLTGLEMDPLYVLLSQPGDEVALRAYDLYLDGSRRQHAPERWDDLLLRSVNPDIVAATPDGALRARTRGRAVLIAGDSPHRLAYSIADVLGRDDRLPYANEPHRVPAGPGADALLNVLVVRLRGDSYDPQMAAEVAKDARLELADHLPRIGAFVGEFRWRGPDRAKRVRERLETHLDVRAFTPVIVVRTTP